MPEDRPRRGHAASGGLRSGFRRLRPPPWGISLGCGIVPMAGDGADEFPVKTPEITRPPAGMAVALSGSASNASHISEVDMGRGFTVRLSLGAALALAAGLGTHAIAAADAPLAIDTARVTINGTSNVHEWTASTAK